MTPVHPDAQASSPHGMLIGEEREAMDHLLAFMDIVVNRWGLRTNHSELAGAIHVLQGFLTQHMLARTAPAYWGDWWGADPHQASTPQGGEAHRAAVPERPQGGAQ